MIPETEKTRNIQNQISKELRVLKNSGAHETFFKLPPVDLEVICAEFQVPDDFSYGHAVKLNK